MGVYVIKPKTPFVTRKELKRTQQSAEYKKAIEFLYSHEFSFSVNKNNGELVTTIIKTTKNNLSDKNIDF